MSTVLLLRRIGSGILSVPVMCVGSDILSVPVMYVGSGILSVPVMCVGRGILSVPVMYVGSRILSVTLKNVCPAIQMSDETVTSCGTISVMWTVRPCGTHSAEDFISWRH